MTAAQDRQLVLDLAHRAALSREDFLVSPSNAAAVAMIDRWPDWPAPALALAGPPGSGKSHLAEIWRQRSGGLTIAAAQLSVAQVPDLIAHGAIAVEDAGPGTDETALFHLLNFARQQAVPMLITSRLQPAHWTIGIPDLLSRLRAMPVIEIGAPDDALLRGVLVKLFADRQLAIGETVISYLVARMPRSLEAARAIVAEIDLGALREKAEVTRPFAARILAGFAAPGLI